MHDPAQHPGFFERAGPFGIAEVARAGEAEVAGAADASSAVSGATISDVLPLDTAGAGHVAFLDNRKYLPQLATTKAAACFLAPEMAERAPPGVVRLVTKAPYRAFAKALHLFYPSAGRPMTSGTSGTEGFVHVSARIGANVTIEPGAVIGREARIGDGTLVAAGALVGARCWVGRDSYIGPGAAVTHALVGDRVLLHAGVRIGQDGFGFAMGGGGHLKVPQIGRVLIHDDVEIGANSTVDRGALKDTVIGQGTKIDNLVQIGHNVVIGRHCVIVGLAGVAGSAVLGDFVVIGGQAGIVGHLHIGSGAQIAGGSGVKDDVPAGERWGGIPAQPLRGWMREVRALRALATRKQD